MLAHHPGRKSMEKDTTCGHEKQGERNEREGKGETFPSSHMLAHHPGRKSMEKRMSKGRHEKEGGREMRER